ncbi:MAG: glucose 1-dehydrogenase [Chloroflexota bacterium]|nr:glucose 1-dehydrogenase [Chloroflexota bacterium]
MGLRDKVAIITGGAQGMGRAMSLRFAKEGACVVVADLNLQGAEQLAQEIESADGQAVAVSVDVRNQEQVQRMVDTAVERFGRLDILVNNAGVGKVLSFLDTTEAEWSVLFDINCKGLLWCSQAAARQMIAQDRGGKIINLASMSGRRGEALGLVYCASKACVISMTQSMGLALAPHKINVNAIAPGIVDTPFWNEVDRQFAKYLNMEVGEPKRTFVQGIPLGRIEQPEDVANAAVFLLREANYISQQTLNVDGGIWSS